MEKFVYKKDITARCKNAKEIAMRKFVLVLAVLAAAVGMAFAQISNNPSVEFAGFVVNGSFFDLTWDDISDIDITPYQGVLIKNNSSETKKVYVSLEIMSGYFEGAENAIVIPPGKIGIAKLVLPPTGKLRKDMVRIKVL